MKHSALKMTLVAAVALGSWTLQPAPASADSVKSTRKVRLMARPGERSRVVKRVPAGKTMKVLDRDGRWVKVRVGSESGWVTRTSVRPTRSVRAARSDVRRNPRRSFVEGRSKRRGDEGPPEDKIGADVVEADEWEDEDTGDRRRSARRDDNERWSEDDDWEDEGDWEDEAPVDEASLDDGMVRVSSKEAEVYQDPSRRAESAFWAEQGDELWVIEKSGDWMQVENDKGDVGWIRAKDVATETPYAYEKLAYKLDGGLGYTALGMSFASDGQGPLANYEMSSAAASLVIGARALYTGGSDTRILMADATYRGTRATPGIRYDDGAGGVTDIGFTMHEGDVGASYGHRFERKDGLAAYARAGYHYSQFDVHDVDNVEQVNLARIPSEQLKGFVVGARLDAPGLGDEWGAAAGFDYMLGATRAQTPGLEDGAVSAVTSWWGMARVDYQWKPDMKLVGAYRYFRATTDWTGAAAASMRGHDATSAARKDVVHTLSVGLGKTF